MKELMKHAGEFLRDLAAKRYERTSDARGLYFNRSKVFVAGDYIHDVNGRDMRVDHNLLPDEGLAYLLNTGLAKGAAQQSWYIALFSGNYTPTAGLTAATFVAQATEIVSASEGYSESTRPVWTPGTVTANALDNTAAKATFTIATSSQVDVHGAALLSDSTKGSTSGVLMSAAKFSRQRTLFNTDVFNLAYRVSLTSA